MSHTWVKIKGNIVTVGLSLSSLQEIGEVVDIQLPKIGMNIKKDTEVCIVESSKSAIDIYSPVSGKIVDINKQIIDSNLINEDPENRGWIFKVEAFDLKELEEI